MNRQERLDLAADVYTSWVARYEDIPDFDPENPTPEQDADYLQAAKKAGLPIGSSEWSDYIASLEADALEELLQSKSYTATSLDDL